MREGLVRAFVQMVQRRRCCGDCKRFYSLTSEGCPRENVGITDASPADDCLGFAPIVDHPGGSND